LPPIDRLAPGQLQVDLLDVGQGLSVLLTAPGHLLVYDTGPGNGLSGEAGWDTVATSIQPMITASGELPGRVIASHGDLDHAGGLRHLMKIYTDAHYLANLRKRPPGVRPCRAPAAWTWGRVRFRVLHPSPGLPYLGNDSSCVLSVQGPGVDMLLPGDISRVVENRLATAGLRPHRLLLVPHHGSVTSSSQRFIDRVRAELALISAAPENRFDLPHEAVSQRYARSRVRVLNSAECGGIRVVGAEAGPLRVSTARKARPALWRWPAGPACP
jgi:competence protein ComEC